MPEHNILTGAQLHEPFNYIGAADPGIVGSGKYWLDTTAAPYILKRRATNNLSWITVGGVGGGGSSFTAVPASYNSSGTAGQYSANSDFIFICYATNLWKKAPLYLFGSSVRTYASDGDTNGVFYYIGTNFETGIWVNPYSAGKIIISTNGTVFGNLSALTDRVGNDFYLQPQAGSNIQFDLGTANLILSRVSFRQRNFGGKADPLADFLIEGSNDAATWTTLMTQVAANVPSGNNVYANWAVTPTIAYRYFRIRQPASSSNFTLGELELYGTLNF